MNKEVYIQKLVMNLGGMESYSAIRSARSIPTKKMREIIAYRENKAAQQQELRDQLEREI
jgi:hypothetical protein